MRDAQKIREISAERPLAGRLGFTVFALLATAIIAYNVGLQAGMSQSEAQEPVARESANLQKLDQAQEKHDAMRFYTKLTESDPANPTTDSVLTEKVVPAPQEPTAEVSVAAKTPLVQDTTHSETARDAVTRMAQSAPKLSGPISGAPPHKNDAQYTVQVSAFQTAEEADAYRASLERKGYEPYVVPADIPGKGIWYRVRVGHFELKEAANRAKAQLAQVNIPSFVVEAK